MGLIQYVEQNKLHFTTMRRTGVGGSAMPKALIAKFNDVYDVEVRHGWGMTETTAIATMSVLGAADAELPPGFAPYRQHYLNQQRAMQTASGRLRGRLRDMLARQSPAKARLAEVDAVMEATLSPREHSLLSHVPVLLGLHYQRLLAAAAHDPADAPASDAPAAPTGPWLVTFRQDLRIALLAELDVRFHPIDGLLAALRTR